MGIEVNSLKRSDKLGTLAQNFLRDERGATAIEYSLIVGLIFLAIVGAIRAYTTTTEGMYTEINTTITDAIE